MSLLVRLLGTPSIERSGAPVPLAGRKTWALLAILAIATRPVRRQELIDRLTSEAEDPQAALRWLLHSVRRALGEEAQVVEDHAGLQLVLSPEASIDVVRLLTLDADPEELVDLVAGNLLDGVSFQDSPAIDFWLTMERTRIRDVAAEALWYAAATIAAPDCDGAMRLVRHGLLLDPFCETKHELLIDLYLQRGDVVGARAHAEAAQRLFRDEFGVDVPESILRPLDRRRPRSSGSAGSSARALLQAAEARFAAGDAERAVETAQRAADEALRADNQQLELTSLGLLSRILVHGNRGRHGEAKGLLTRAAQLAIELDDHAALADIERELGFVLLIEGKYGSADPLLARSRALAASMGDARRAAQADTYHGISRSDQCDFDGAATLLAAATAGFAGLADDGWLGYAEAMAARALMRSSDIRAARTFAVRARDRITRSGWTAVLPWPMLVEAECLLDLEPDDVRSSADAFSEALELSIEIGDPLCESLALRGMAKVEVALGDRAGAVELLERALLACRRFATSYAWAETAVLVDLVELQPGQRPDDVETAFMIAAAGPMPDLAARLLPWRAGTGRAPQTLLQTASV